MLSFFSNWGRGEANTSTHRGPKRAVILIGPPKTGSTHIQGFLVANRDHLRKHGWQMPRGVDGADASKKSFANLAAALWNHSCTGMWNRAPSLATAIITLCHGRQNEQRVYRGPPERTLAIYAREFRRIAASRDAPNLVLSAEDLALFDGDDPGAVGARARLRQLLSPFDEVEAVMVYRTPRAQAAQLISHPNPDS